MRRLATTALLSLSLAAAAVAVHAQAPAVVKPQVVALVAAVGDQIDVVRQRESVGSNREPFSRKTMAVNGQALNLAVLKGLDRAVAEGEPQSTRVMLAWSSPPELADRLMKVSGAEREALVLEALKSYLKNVPERANWDRIEAVVPSYFYESVKGLGRKLSGVGFYVQPLKNNKVVMNENGNIEMDAVSDKRADLRTVDPNTGNIGYSDVYIAPYLYIQRVTFDAKTLEVTGRQRMFGSTKYADPTATQIDVGDQIPLNVMTAKLLDVVERSAYGSVRGESTVTVTTPQEVPSAASAPR
ncbi:hypothetical protein [Pelomonas sp. KK5]|uniref:hypothetical protein n=1 Tax=Pelomonas sp. KK5 TaxID=1855730 RepID=UPI00097CB171|nr:hypothetical protein [Pelomonas sp. KK5]